VPPQCKSQINAAEPHYGVGMADAKNSDEGMVAYTIGGVVGGILLGVVFGLLVPSIGVGFGIGIGMAVGITVAVIIWIMRRQGRG